MKKEKIKYIILSEKKWHSELYINLKAKFIDYEWILINNKIDFNFEFLKSINPKIIFIPHWSNIISSDIYLNFECIVFHMTDLPYGRGGSPLQNLILRGKKTTKISSLKVSKGIDTGDIYNKMDLSLNGSASEIFNRSTFIIEKMIIDIITNNPTPKPQEGEIIEFTRRKPKESNISLKKNLHEIYDYIRMLDCEGYPKAFVETNNIRFEFENAKLNKTNNEIIANVRITKK